jgi:hypothetical protein
VYFNRWYWKIFLWWMFKSIWSFDL